MKTQLGKAFVCCKVEKINHLHDLEARYVHAARLGLEHPSNADARLKSQNVTLLDPKAVLARAIQANPSGKLEISLRRCQCRDKQKQQPEVPARLISAADLRNMDCREALILALFWRIGDKKVRNNAVLAGEEVAACPSTKWDLMTDSERQEFVKIVFRNLQRAYADRLIGIAFNGDEEGGHIHAFFVPLDDQGKLNARSFLMRSFLKSRHTNLASDLGHLGFIRGAKFFKIPVERLQEFYRNVASAPVALEVELPDIPVQAPNESGIDYRMRICQNLNAILAPRASVVSDKAADRDKQAKKVARLEQRLSEVMAQTARMQWEWACHRRDMERELIHRKRQLDYKRHLEWKLIRVEEPPLAIVAEQLLGKSCDERADVKVYEFAGREFTIIGNDFKVTGANTHQTGAIDFICEVLSCDTSDALGILRRYFPEEQVTVCQRSQLMREATLARDPWPWLKSTLRRHGSILECRPTLEWLASLGLKDAFVQQARQRQQLHIGEAGNLIFWHRASAGNILGASFFSPPDFHRANHLGSVDTPFRWGTRGSEACLVDTPLQAMLLAAEHELEGQEMEIVAIEGLVHTKALLRFLMQNHDYLHLRCQSERVGFLLKQCEDIGPQIGMSYYAKFRVDQGDPPRPRTALDESSTRAPQR